MRKPFYYLFLKNFLFGFIFFVFPFFVFAQSTSSTESVKCEAGDKECFGLHDAAQAGGFKAIEDGPSLAVIIGTAIQYVLSFVGIIFLVLVIYGGFLWMFAQGDETKITKARNLIIHAAIGLLIVLSAYIITRFVTEVLIGIVEN